MRKWSIGEFNAFFDFALLGLIKVRLALLRFLPAYSFKWKELLKCKISDTPLFRAHVTHCNKLLNNMEKSEDWPAQAVKRIGSCVRLDGPSEVATGGVGLLG